MSLTTTDSFYILFWTTDLSFDGLFYSNDIKNSLPYLL